MSSTSRRGSRRVPAVLVVMLLAAVASAVAFLEVWQATRGGPGITRDSVDYLSAAESIRQGEGATLAYPSYNELPPRDVVHPTPVAMTTRPPLFPALVAGAAALSGQGVVGTARTLDALALSLTILLVGVLVWRRTRTALWPVAAMVLLLTQSDLVLVHSMVWSEPCALVLMVAALLALTEYAEAPRPSLLAAAAALTGAAVMVRYAAIALLPVGLLAVVLAEPRGRRLRSALLLGALGLGPSLAWTVRDLLQTGGMAAGHLGWHPPSRATLAAAGETLYGWLSPVEAARAPLLALLLSLAAVSVARTPWRGSRRLAATGGILAAAAVASYLAVLWVASAIFDASLAVDDVRILSPVLVLGAILLTSAVGMGASRWPRRLRNGAGAAAVALLTVSAAQAATMTSGLAGRLGYASEPWRHSATFEVLARLPAADLLVTNAPDFVWLRMRRTSVAEPRRFFAVSRLPNLEYDAELAAIRRAVETRGHGWLVLWNDAARPYLPDAGQLDTRLRTRVVATAPDGRVLELLP
jgi:hypothetical protein